MIVSSILLLKTRKSTNKKKRGYQEEEKMEERERGKEKLPMTMLNLPKTSDYSLFYSLLYFRSIT